MGRPKSLATTVSEESTGVDDTIVTKVATLLQEYCSIPGCTALLHKQEALELIKIIKGGK